MPVRHTSTDPAARIPVETFQALLVDELRKVPGIDLRFAADVTPPDGARPEYQLVVASLAVTRLANGGESYASLYEPQRRGMYAVMSGLSGNQWPVEIRVERNGQLAPARGNRDAIVHLAREGAPRPPICNQELRPQNGIGLMCLDPAQLAGFVADGLRLQVLPPDQGMYRKLVGRIGDASLSERQRSLDLNALLMARREGRFADLDVAGRHAIASFAASSSSDMRGVIWRLLRGDPQAGLVDQMLDSLRADASPDTRLEALTTLVELHGTEPGVRAALQTTSRDDPRELIRMLARRALGGETDWRRYVITTLNDSRLSAHARTEPLLYAEQRAQSLASRTSLAELARSPQFADALLAAARDARPVTDIGERGPIRRSLNILLGLGDPAVLARHADWPDLQREFSAGPRTVPAGPPAWTGLDPAPVQSPAR